jgi:hypothetical protein
LPRYFAVSGRLTLRAPDGPSASPSGVVLSRNRPAPASSSRSRAGDDLYLRDALAQEDGCRPLAARDSPGGISITRATGEFGRCPIDAVPSLLGARLEHSDSMADDVVFAYLVGSLSQHQGTHRITILLVDSAARQSYAKYQFRGTLPRKSPPASGPRSREHLPAPREQLIGVEVVTSGDDRHRGSRLIRFRDEPAPHQ